MNGGTDCTVLHYAGGDDDRGGIVSAVRAIAGAAPFACVLGVNPGFRWRRPAALPLLRLPFVACEAINLRTVWQTRAVARQARAWLQADRRRIFHGRSRTGLLAALWLDRWGERRVAASVHCLGRQRWFYRHATARLGGRLTWLGPAMKRHYGMGDDTWLGCVPDCLATDAAVRPPRARQGLRVGCVGSILPVKEWDLAIEALARVPGDADVRLVHVGSEDGTRASREYARHLRVRSDALGVASGVEWQGERAELHGFFAAIDCLLVASRWEASSMAALEAVFAGVPVVAADAAGTQDLIAVADAGWLFRAGDADDLARRLTALARSGGVEEKTPSPERLRPFTAAVVAGQWAEFYGRLLQSVAD
jgi:glycosyltransferase involved in cell wall biosynthesis